MSDEMYDEDDMDCDVGTYEGSHDGTGNRCMENAVAESHEVKWFRLEVRSEVDADIPVAFVFVQAWTSQMASCLGDFFAAGYHVVDVVEAAPPLANDIGANGLTPLENEKATVRALREQLEQERRTNQQATNVIEAYAAQRAAVREAMFAMNRGQAAQTQVLAQMLEVLK